MKTGILGGTFNPVHFGHLRVAEEVREKLNFERILFIPSSAPPLKTEDLADAGHRYEMTRLATGTNPFFEISDIESKRSGKSYTVETLITLREIYPDNEFYFIVGIDSFLDIPAWHQPERIMDLTNFVVVSRPGFHFLSLSSMTRMGVRILSKLDSHELEMYKSGIKTGRELYLLNVTPMDISATDLRRRIRTGMSIKYLLPENVESYIISNRLYMEGSDHL